MEERSSRGEEEREEEELETLKPLLVLLLSLFPISLSRKESSDQQSANETQTKEERQRSQHGGQATNSKTNKEQRLGKIEAMYFWGGKVLHLNFESLDILLKNAVRN